MDEEEEVMYSFISAEDGLMFNHKNGLKLEHGYHKFEEGFFDESAYIIEKYQVRKVSLVDPQKKPYITVSFQAPVVGITIEKSGDKRCGYFLQRALLYLQEQLQFLQK